MKELILLVVGFALCAVAAGPALGAPARARQNARARVAIFAEAGFPAIDSTAVDAAALQAALPGFDVAVFDSKALAATLQAASVDVLVLPFGSAFPQAAWPSIARFLSGGGSLVNLGGVPFAVPVLAGKDG